MPKSVNSAARQVEQHERLPVHAQVRDGEEDHHQRVRHDAPRAARTSRATASGGASGASRPRSASAGRGRRATGARHVGARRRRDALRRLRVRRVACRAASTTYAATAVTCSGFSILPQVGMPLSSTPSVIVCVDLRRACRRGASSRRSGSGR